MYVFKELKWKKVVSRQKSKSWVIVISIDDRNYYGRFGVIYKSPKEKINDFLSFVDDLLEDAVCLETRNFIFGDMNINVRRKTKNAKKYLSLIENHGLMQCVDKPTRETKKSSTTIDHILTNVEKLDWIVNMESPVDHYLLEVIVNSQKKKLIDRRRIKFTSWKNYSAEKIKEMLKEIEWNAAHSANEVTANVCSNLMKILSSLVTKREKLARHVNNKWFSPKIACMRKLIKNATDKFSHSNNPDDKCEINRLMREYRNAITDAKNEHVKNQFATNRNDSKKLWRTLKSLYSDKGAEIKSVEYEDDKVIDDDFENAERLNHHFAESISSLVRNIETARLSNYTNLISFHASKFDLCEIEMNDLLRIVKDLKKKSFDDNINGRVLNDAVNDVGFAEQLLMVVNLSIRQSIMPDELKTSTVTPIPKVTSPKTPDDLRPVNNLPVIEKIIECVVHEQLIEYLNANDILCDQQAGFRKQHSTESSILSVLHDLFEAGSAGKKTVGVFIDLRRAFETVSRDELIEKMRRYGFSEKTLAWFRSFLSDRKQRVKFNGCLSDPIDVLHGLPQGSKLSNLLFILFINDLPLNLTHAKINMFADDCLIYTSHANIDEASKMINEDLETVADWLRFNRMALNVKKCASMFFGLKRNDVVPKVTADGEEIERVSCTKYLGVWIDEKLSFKCHAMKVIAKMNKRLALLRRLQAKMTYESKVIYFKSIILPNIDYCSSIFLHFNDSDVKTIQRVLNKAMRIIFQLPRGSDVDEMHEKLKIMTCKQRLHFNVLKTLHKTLTRGMPKTLFSKFKRRGDTRQKVLRFDYLIDVPAWKTKNQCDSIFINSVKNYNLIAKNCKPNDNFHERMKKFVKENYKY